MSNQSDIFLEEIDQQELSQEQVDNEVSKLTPLAVEAVRENQVGDYQGNIKDRFQEEMQFSIVRFTWATILGNRFSNGAAWGQARTGKTTCVMRLANTVYHDWDLVLKCIGFGLNSIIYKMNNRVPTTILEQDIRIYHRVPFLVNDDAGSVDNKSVTANDESFNYLKGGIDLWGTRMACLWHTLNSPTELTSQLNQKYTCELYVEHRGEAKFDTCRWQPNFKGWVPNQKKKWRQSFFYDRVPKEIYEIYAEKRDAIIDEQTQLYNDSQANTQITKLLTRCTPKQIETLQYIQLHAPMTSYDVDKANLDKDAIKSLKGRDLIESTMIQKGHYKLDMLPLGLELLRAKTITEDPEAYKKELRKND